MIRCQNCGQGNSDGSNFCRSCGIKFAHLRNQPPRRQTYQQPNRNQRPPEQAQRRPYSWKTDELQLKKKSTSARNTQQINRVRPLAELQNPTSPMYPPQHNQAIQQNRQPGNMTAHGYRCPRCASQLLPQVTKKISTAGWIVFAVLLIAFFPLFWIGFLIKEEVRVCPVCNVELR